MLIFIYISLLTWHVLLLEHVILNSYDTLYPVVCDLFSDLYKDLMEFEMNTVQYNAERYILFHLHLYTEI
jgi:hypothetical protein